MYQTINNSITHKPWIPASAGTSFTKHWALKNCPKHKQNKNQPKNPTKSNYKGESMTNHILNAQPNTLLNANSGLQTKGHTEQNSYYTVPKNPIKPASSSRRMSQAPAES